jgi:hypothetical protein
MASVPAFRKPTFSYSWDVDEELKALRGHLAATIL